MAADYSTGAAIFLFFLLTLLLNPLAQLLTGSRLHSGEFGDHLHNDDRGFGDSLLGFCHEPDPVFRGTVLFCHAGE